MGKVEREEGVSGGRRELGKGKAPLRYVSILDILFETILLFSAKRYEPLKNNYVVEF